jgi:hypothetical protein
MTDLPTLITLAHWLAGEFDNQPQASEQPVWFVHLRLWQRPLPHRIQGHLALFVEQANTLYLNQPYRQRVMLLQALAPDRLQVQYWALKHPGQFQGAGANSTLLKELESKDLEELPGCVLQIAKGPEGFVAEPPEGAKCYFQYQGATRQVVLGFKVSLGSFCSYDRGVDPQTGQALWGALMGPYKFQKCQDFAAEFPA